LGPPSRRRISDILRVPRAYRDRKLIFFHQRGTTSDRQESKYEERQAPPFDWRARQALVLQFLFGLDSPTRVFPCQRALLSANGDLLDKSLIFLSFFTRSCLRSVAPTYPSVACSIMLPSSLSALSQRFARPRDSSPLGARSPGPSGLFGGFSSVATPTGIENSSNASTLPGDLLSA